MSARSRFIKLAGAVAVCAAITGCGAQMPVGSQLFDQAKAANLQFKAAVAAVQMQIYDGDWVFVEYGNSPMTCGKDGYKFEMARDPLKVEGWKLPGSAAESARDLATWLTGEGWQDVKVITYSPDLPNATVTASNPDKKVAKLDVIFYTRDTTDSASVDATTTCLPGNVDELTDLIFPGFPDTRNLEFPPTIGHPLDPPVFELHPKTTSPTPTSTP